jgi:hypothetical protein
MDPSIKIRLVRAQASSVCQSRINAVYALIVGFDYWSRLFLAPEIPTPSRRISIQSNAAKDITTLSQRKNLQIEMFLRGLLSCGCRSFSRFFKSGMVCKASTRSCSLFESSTINNVLVKNGRCHLFPTPRDGEKRSLSLHVLDVPSQALVRWGIVRFQSVGGGKPENNKPYLGGQSHSALITH